MVKLETFSVDVVVFLVCSITVAGGGQVTIFSRLLIGQHDFTVMVISPPADLACTELDSVFYMWTPEENPLFKNTHVHVDLASAQELLHRWMWERRVGGVGQVTG